MYNYKELIEYKRLHEFISNLTTIQCECDEEMRVSLCISCDAKLALKNLEDLLYLIKRK